MEKVAAALSVAVVLCGFDGGGVESKNMVYNTSQGIEVGSLIYVDEGADEAHDFTEWSFSSRKLLAHILPVAAYLPVGLVQFLVFTVAVSLLWRFFFRTRGDSTEDVVSDVQGVEA